MERVDEARSFIHLTNTNEYKKKKKMKMEVEIYRFQNLIAKMCFISDLVHIIDSIHFLSFHSLCVCCVRLDLNRIYFEIEINIRNGSLLRD